ncbi:MAG: hypothetical protein GY730_04670, partial [bacterium]|nr:hypothetical protein [bacterium]
MSRSINYDNSNRRVNRRSGARGHIPAAQNFGLKNILEDLESNFEIDTSLQNKYQDIKNGRDEDNKRTSQKNLFEEAAIESESYSSKPDSHVNLMSLWQNISNYLEKNSTSISPESIPANAMKWILALRIQNTSHENKAHKIESLFLPYLHKSNSESIIKYLKKITDPEETKQTLKDLFQSHHLAQKDAALKKILRKLISKEDLKEICELLFDEIGKTDKALTNNLIMNLSSTFDGRNNVPDFREVFAEEFQNKINEALEQAQNQQQAQNPQQHLDQAGAILILDPYLTKATHLEEHNNFQGYLLAALSKASRNICKPEYRTSFVREYCINPAIAADIYNTTQETSQSFLNEIFPIKDSEPDVKSGNVIKRVSDKELRIIIQMTLNDIDSINNNSIYRNDIHHTRENALNNNMLHGKNAYSKIADYLENKTQNIKSNSGKYDINILKSMSASDIMEVKTGTFGKNKNLHTAIDVLNYWVRVAENIDKTIVYGSNSNALTHLFKETTGDIANCPYNAQSCCKDFSELIDDMKKGMPGLNLFERSRDLEKKLELLKSDLEPKIKQLRKGPGKKNMKNALSNIKGLSTATKNITEFLQNKYIKPMPRQTHIKEALKNNNTERDLINRYLNDLELNITKSIDSIQAKKAARLTNNETEAWVIVQKKLKLQALLTKIKNLKDKINRDDLNVSTARLIED